MKNRLFFLILNVIYYVKGTELILNGGFEDGTAGWESMGESSAFSNKN